MDLRLVVGGLIARNPVLSTLLANYAARLEEDRFGYGAATSPSFIVPTWSVDRFSHVPAGSRLLTVEAHTSSTDPRRHENLDTILRVVHMVLTDDHAGAAIIARRLATPADLVASDLGTVVRVGMWDIAPVPSAGAEAAQRRLLPWPDCSTSVITTGALAPRTVSMN
jgi:hypothetical protein